LTSYIEEDGAGLKFCSKCGSTLCGIVGGNVHGVTLGCVNGDPEVEIGQHIFVGSKATCEATVPLGLHEQFTSVNYDLSSETIYVKR